MQNRIDNRIALFYLSCKFSIQFYFVFSILYSILSCKLSKVRIDVLYLCKDEETVLDNWSRSYCIYLIASSFFSSVQIHYSYICILFFFLSFNNAKTIQITTSIAFIHWNRYEEIIIQSSHYVTYAVIILASYSKLQCHMASNGAIKRRTRGWIKKFWNKLHYVYIPENRDILSKKKIRYIF